MTLDADIARLEEAVNAPRELARLRMRRAHRTRRHERQAWANRAAELDPEYPRKLADARADVERLEAEVARHEEARRPSRPRSGSQERPTGLEAPSEARGATGEQLVIRGGMLGPRGRPGIFGTFLPPPTPRHQLAIDELGIARGYLKKLERWPSEIEVSELRGQGAGETTDERIRNAPHVSFGVKVRRALTPDQLRRMGEPDRGA